MPRYLVPDQPLGYGELGTLPRLGGGFSTEIMVGIQDPRLYMGRQTNIPLLQRGQVGVQGLLAGQRPTREQYEMAIRRAAERIAAGEAFPNFSTQEEADEAERGRHKLLDAISAPWGEMGKADMQHVNPYRKVSPW